MKVVLLPGLDGTAALLSEIEAVLSAQYPVLRISYPNHLASYVELLDWTLAQLPDEPYLLVAESFSGPLGALIRARADTRLAATIFVATFARRPRRISSRLAAGLRYLSPGNALLSRLLQPVLMGRWSNARFRTSFDRALATVPAATLAARLAEVLRCDVTRALEQAATPMLYLRATKDRLVPASMAEDFRRHGCEIREIEAPHFLLQAKPNEAGAAILQLAVGGTTDPRAPG